MIFQSGKNANMELFLIVENRKDKPDRHLEILDYLPKTKKLIDMQRITSWSNSSKTKQAF